MGNDSDVVIGARFPFGEPLRRVRQTDRTPKRVFVLGVYASAVHAHWVKDDATVVTALAVASEPCIFWKGDGAEDIIRRIKIPASLGTLESPPGDRKLNGPSGAALDSYFLLPLGIDRTDAWLCDLVPYSCVNAGQQAAIRRAYPHYLPPPSIPKKPKPLADDRRRREILSEIRESKASVIILLGDEPIQWFLSKLDTRWKKLADFKPYGQLHSVVIDDMKLSVLPLVHPRQAAGLGKHSPEWREKHEQWIRASASRLLSKRQ